MEGKRYAYLLDRQYRWDVWAAPKRKNGEIDHNSALTGYDLLQFVNGKLFPYLQRFKQRASGPNTLEYKIGEIFGEIQNKISSGYNLREIIDRIDSLKFRSQEEKHELSHLYEAKIRNMGNAGRNGGEYYTPRPLIRAMVRVVNPKIGERIIDSACGSCGFLCEAFDHLLAKPRLTTRDLDILQTRTFYGKEKKSLAYVIGIMNMILHGIDAPNIVHTNIPAPLMPEASGTTPAPPSNPEGMQACSRWFSAAIPPVNRFPNSATPAGVVFPLLSISRLFPKRQRTGAVHDLADILLILSSGSAWDGGTDTPKYRAGGIGTTRAIQSKPTTHLYLD